MKRQQKRRKQPHFSDSPQSDIGGLLKTGVFSLLLHIFLTSLLIFSLKAGTIKSGPPVYRVTIQPLSLKNNSNPQSLQALPAHQPIPAKTQIQKKEENRPKEEVKQSKPIEEPKPLPQPQVDDQSIQKPIPLPMAETSTSKIDADLEKEQIPTPIAALPSEEKNTFKESGTRSGTGMGGSALSGSGEGEGTGEGGSRWGGEGTGPGRRGSGWISSGEGSGKGKGGSGFGGSAKGPWTGTGRGGSRGGPGGSGSGAASPRYGENPKPPYPQEARNKGYQGKVVLKVEVLPNGRVGEIEVKESSGYEGLDQSALDTVKKWRFIPATKGGVAIPCWVNIPITFQLQDISF